jgi:predicted nucleic acid-binding protein
MVLLDSTVLIDCLRGRAALGRVRQLLESGEQLGTTGVNVDEVVRGLRPAEDRPARVLFDGLRVLPIARGEGWLAGSWRRDFAGRGVTLSQADCLIAAAAVSAGARLATGNPRDFPMPGLVVEHWPVG